MAGYHNDLHISVTVGDRRIVTQKEIFGSTWSRREVFVPDGASDLVLAFPIDVSQIVNLLLYSARAIKLETNSPTTPDNTIDLKAGVPLLWNADAYFPCPLTVDVSTFYITNTSGYAANVLIEVQEQVS